MGLSCGQVLFKLAARAPREGGPEGFLAMVLNPFLVAGLTLYGVVTLLWVALLRTTPLSRAYPFAALAFVIVPLFSWVLFGERFGLPYVIGMLLIVIGVIVSSL